MDELTQDQPTQEDVQPAQAESDVAPGGEEETLVAELRLLGKHLAAAMKAAAGTPEAQRLKEEVRAGTQALEREIGGAVSTSREMTARTTSDYRSAGVSRLRSDLAKALQTVNRALDDLARSIEPSPTDTAGEDEDQPSTNG